MRKLIILLLVSIISSSVYAQMVTVTTDPTSMAQRMALFLEQMDEALLQGSKLSTQIETAEKTLELAKESKEKLKRVSQFIKTGSVVVEITGTGAELVGKISKYRDLLNKSNLFSDEERYTLLDQIVTMANMATDKVKEGLSLTKDNSSDGEFNDYERLQLLKQIKGEIEEIVDNIDLLYNRAMSRKSHQQVTKGLTTMSVNAMTCTSDILDYKVSKK